MKATTIKYFPECKRITKRAACELYNSGKKVYVLPCNATNPLIFGMNPLDLNRFAPRDFETAVKDYTNAWCNSRCGRYPAFYIKEV